MAEAHGDALMLKHLLLFVIVAVASFAVTLYFINPPVLQYVIGHLANLTKPLQQVGERIPSQWHGIITMAVPTAFAVFFAWTKMRAMTKLQQVQQQASMQIDQVQGEKQVLEQQLADTTAGGVEQLIRQRDSAQSLVTNLQGQVSQLKGQIQGVEAERDKLLASNSGAYGVVAEVKKVIEDSKKVP